MKKWRIRKQSIDGVEWFYPERRTVLLGWSAFEHFLSGAVRFEDHGAAIMWIQKQMIREREKKSISYTYPFD